MQPVEQPTGICLNLTGQAPLEMKAPKSHKPGCGKNIDKTHLSKTSIPKISWKHRERGWGNIECINPELYSPLNFQTDRSLFSITSPLGKNDLSALFDAYWRGEPVPTPGASETLTKAAEIVTQLQEE